MAEVRSQNGWTAPGRSVIATYTVPGTTLRVPLRTGDVSVVLLEYLRRYHLEVESLYHQPQDLWGYADRNVRGSATTVSNHASGTAVDARAVKNGLGMRGTFTAAQGHALDRLLAYFEGVLRHGKSYTSRPDPMHAEINANAAAVKRIADKIRAGVPPTIPAVSPNPVESSVSLTKTQAEQLNVVVQQLCGSNVPHEFPGWQTWPGGSVRADGKPDSFTVVDYLRKQNQRAEDTVRALADVRARVDALAVGRPVAPTAGPAVLSDADVKRIASAVLDELSKRTAA